MNTDKALNLLAATIRSLQIEADALDTAKQDANWRNDKPGSSFADGQAIGLRSSALRLMELESALKDLAPRKKAPHGQDDTVPAVVYRHDSEETQDRTPSLLGCVLQHHYERGWQDRHDRALTIDEAAAEDAARYRYLADNACDVIMCVSNTDYGDGDKSIGPRVEVNPKQYGVSDWGGAREKLDAAVDALRLRRRKTSGPTLNSPKLADLVRTLTHLAMTRAPGRERRVLLAASETLASKLPTRSKRCA